MSRLSTRTKIAVGVGLVLCVLAWLILRPAPPPVTVSFVRYEDPSNPSVVIYVTNCTSTPVHLIGEHHRLDVRVAPHCYAFAKVPHAPRQIQITGYRLSGFRTWSLNHQRQLGKLGLTRVLFHPDFTVALDLPPPEP